MNYTYKILKMTVPEVLTGNVRAYEACLGSTVGGPVIQRVKILPTLADRFPGVKGT